MGTELGVQLFMPLVCKTIAARI